MKQVKIDGDNLTLEDVQAVALHGAKVRIHPKAAAKIKKCRKFVKKIVDTGQTVYGINTGFGSLCNKRISKKDIEKLQENLIVSHALSVGPVFSEEEVRAIMLLRANVLAKGFSGVRLELIQTLVEMINKRVHPMIPEKGSVGASGDLAPLAFMALPLVGKGWVFYQGRLMEGKKAFRKAGVSPLKVSSKEGLALINGTCVMTAIGVLTLLKAERLAELADMAGAMSLEAALCTPTAFDPNVQKVRKHKGQRKSADNLVNLTRGSQIREFHKACPKVQDPYSFRCMPQVHGAIRDTFSYIRSVLEIEINSATDNPLIFPDENKVISAGNFHGEPVALGLDFLSIAISELASISERRIAALINPATSGLPAALTAKPGLNSGFMMAQIVAASLVSENKCLTHPASVDSIPTSMDQEDHVSMGTIAARKAREVVNNTEDVLAIEFLAASQGIDFRSPLKPGIGTGKIHQQIRKRILPVTKDRLLVLDLVKIKELMRRGFEI
ncbi:MAG: histidine ammonia-lyase [candidate division Zixibacteria bacterium SM23_73_3]|nr:MAG: histidine ammonia-lyase [candidate division Zixibacteria bacterium SM23_73_3]